MPELVTLSTLCCPLKVTLAVKVTLVPNVCGLAGTALRAVVVGAPMLKMLLQARINRHW